MPDFVNDDDLSALAGEYVLGTLDPTERTRANALLEADKRFRGLVRVWELRFGELHLMVEPVAPDGKVWQRVRDRLGIGPREPAPPPAPAPAMARAEAPAVAKPEAIKRDEIKPEVVRSAEIKPDAVRPEQAKLAEVEPDATASDDLNPEQRLAELIEEVEKYTETMKGDARPPAPPTVEAAPALTSVESVATPKPALTTAEAATPPPKPQLTTAEATTPKPEPGTEDEPKDMQRILRDAAARDAAAAALVAVEEAREHLRRRPHERPPRGWRTVALVMTFVAAGLTGLIAAWRFAPGHLPAPLHPTAVLNMPESPPGERNPAPHGTQFEE